MKPGGEDDTDLLVEKKPKIARPRRWGVAFWNDDYTTKWFVVHVLQEFFHMDETRAAAFMLTVHRKGRGITGVYTREIAETKAAHVMEYAREYGMPLLVTPEPYEDDDEGS